MDEDAGTTRRSRADREARRSARRTPAGFDAHGLRNALGPSTILDEEQVELIHEASLDLLQDVGIELMGPAARAAFRTAGAIVDDASGLVRVPREVVEQAVASAPTRFTVTPRNPRRALDVGGDAVAFGLVAGPPTVHDRVRGRRSGNLDDYVTLLKLAQSFDVIHFVGNQPTSPIELPANTRHLDCYRANVTYTDRTYPLPRDRARADTRRDRDDGDLPRPHARTGHRRPVRADDHLRQLPAPVRRGDDATG